MGFLRPLFHPTDPRWKPSQRTYYPAFHVKNVILGLFIILVIVEGALFYKWWPDRTDVGDEHSPYWFGLRIGIALIPDIVISLVTGFLMLKSKLHPIYALISSFVLFGLYAGACFINSLVALSNETSFGNVGKWYALVHVEAGGQGLLGLIHLGMLIYGCIATHRWRKARNARENAPLKNVASVSSAEAGAAA